MQWESVLAWRMARQHLAERADRSARGRLRHLRPARPGDVVRAAHAVGARRGPAGRRGRCCGSSDELVKTWAMRGTLHLLRTDELPLYVGAQGGLKPRYEQKSWLKHFELTPEDAQAILTEVPRALQGRPAHPRGADRARPRRPQPRLWRPAQAGRVPRRPDLRALRGPERALRAARAVRAHGRRGGHARARPPLPHPLRPGDPRGVREVVRRARRPPRRAAGSRRSATR